MTTRSLFIVLFMAFCVTALLVKDLPWVTLQTDSEARAARYRHPRTLAPSGVATPPSHVETQNPLTLTELAAYQFGRAKLSVSTAEMRAAEARATALVKVWPRHAPGLVLLAEILENRHAFAQSTALAEQALALGAGPSALRVLVTSNLALGNLGEARRAAELLVISLPTAQSYQFRALVNEAQGRLREAKYDFASAVSHEEVCEAQDAAHLRSLWARFLLKAGDLRRAAAVQGEAERIAPQYAFTLSVGGDLALAQGRPKVAAQKFFEAFRLSKTPRYLVWYAESKRQAGESKVAEEALATAISLLRQERGNSPASHDRDLAEALLKEGSFESRREAAQLIGEESKRRPSVEVLLLATEIYVSLQDWPAAGQTLASLTTLGCRQARFFALQAQTEEAKGNRQRAGLFRALSETVL